MSGCAPVEYPVWARTVREREQWLEEELYHELMRDDVLECRVERLTAALAKLQGESDDGCDREG